MGLPVGDLDFAVDGDAVDLARKVAQDLGGTLRQHGRFGTATVEVGEQRLDFATTRRETYDRPGALPRVETAPIEEDLLRRDFTINAMALALAPQRRVALLDPYGGRLDLSRGRLRILHPRSFEEDPTRAYRAARYANRLRFSIEPVTRRASVEAVAAGFFDHISGDRRRREIRLILSEAHRPGAIRQLARLGLVATLASSLPSGGEVLARLRSAERLAGHIPKPTSWILYLLVWASSLAPQEAEALAGRLSLAGEEGRIVRSWPQTLVRFSGSGQPPSPSELAHLRLSSDETAAAAVCARRAEVRRVLRRHLERDPIELSIGGRDLLSAGIPPGPSVGRALARTLAARRDGKISRERELAFALHAARSDSS